MSIFTILNQHISIKGFREDKLKLLSLMLLSTSILALVIAYFVEHILHIKPCSLCIYQRFPYLILIKLALTGIVIDTKFSNYLTLMVLATLFGAILLSGYHVGIERGIFELSNLCKTYNFIPDHLSIKEVKKLLYSSQGPTCDKVELKIFALSMAEWNLLLNSILLIISVRMCYRRGNNAKTIL